MNLKNSMCGPQRVILERTLLRTHSRNRGKTWAKSDELASPPGPITRRPGDPFRFWSDPHTWLPGRGGIQQAARSRTLFSIPALQQGPSQNGYAGVLASSVFVSLGRQLPWVLAMPLHLGIFTETLQSLVHTRRLHNFVAFGLFSMFHPQG